MNHHLSPAQIMSRDMNYSTDVEAKDFLKPKLLKGKPCFHLKKESDNELLAQIEEVLDKGFALYKTKGWI
ncbi:hypothetical protein [Solitalea lacus]|uniref:hypothetical protein n=1 Tax=Solitalea lacus TaxID=2911172 RepID=UPI001EDA10B1|nr:hypothetical protein [Solitalea lacus]UKJ08018.1 hypothetical protein L2B55_02340 [Solitalea lacus]